MQQIHIRLIGNPNSGKSTLFNLLTGANQTTGNWPGVTIQKKEGTVKKTNWKLTDLPGLYSLAAFSPEERATKEYLQTEPPDFILNILDATALERNLFLTMQLKELGIPVVVALNFYDEILKKKSKIDLDLLSDRLGFPVVPISAKKGENIELLFKTIQKQIKTRKKEGKGIVPPVFSEKIYDSEERYKAVEETLAGVLQSPQKPDRLTEKLDDIFTHKILAIPIFLFFMLVLFGLIFGPVGMQLKAWCESGVLWVSARLQNMLTGFGARGILAFLPQMALLFLFLSVLEDSGYMARGAFVMDKMLQKAGLSGKAFIPLLMGFGCTTPAAMATRVLENENERKRTLFLLPFFSCGAKLPVYIFISAAFFPDSKGFVLFFLYIFGVALGICLVWLLGMFSKSKKEGPFLMELPAYRILTILGTFRHLWEKCKGFVAKTGTVIVALSALIWLLQHVTFSLRWTSQPSISIFGEIGRCLAPVFAPLGFGNWQTAVSLLTGILAKEAVVSSMRALYAHTGMGAVQSLQSVFTKASALSFLVFVLLYMPCVASFACIKRELCSLKTAVAAMLLQTAVAYGASFLVYQLAKMFFG